MVILTNGIYTNKNTKVTMVPVVVGALGTVSKNLDTKLNVQEIRGII